MVFLSRLVRPEPDFFIQYIAHLLEVGHCDWSFVAPVVVKAMTGRPQGAKEDLSPEALA